MQQDAICVGCGKKASELTIYNDDNPVTEDGSYSNGKFVCDGCYCLLIDRGLDVGSPEQLQERVKAITTNWPCRT